MNFFFKENKILKEMENRKKEIERRENHSLSLPRSLFFSSLFLLPCLTLPHSLLFSLASLLLPISYSFLPLSLLSLFRRNSCSSLICALLSHPRLSFSSLFPLFFFVLPLLLLSPSGVSLSLYLFLSLSPLSLRIPFLLFLLSRFSLFPSLSLSRRKFRREERREEKPPSLLRSLFLSYPFLSLYLPLFCGLSSSRLPFSPSSSVCFTLFSPSLPRACVRT